MKTPFLQAQTVWQSLRFDWLWVYHGAVPVTETWSKLITVPAGWFWVEAGCARLRTSGRESIVKPGQSFFSAPGIRQQWFSKGTRLLSVGFRCDWPSGEPVFQSGLNVMLTPAKSGVLLAATRQLFHIIHGQRAEVTYREAIHPQPATLKRWSQRELAFRHWFQQYLDTVEGLGVRLQPTGRMDQSLGCVLKKLESWPLNEPLRLSSLAASLLLGERRLRDLLRGHLGMTAQAWMERRRLNAACEELTSHDMPLKQIAFTLGFRHPPHFTAWFKRHTGLTPTAFREGGGLDGA